MIPYECNVTLQVELLQSFTIWIGILNVYTQCDLMPELELREKQQTDKNHKLYSEQRLFVLILGGTYTLRKAIVIRNLSTSWWQCWEKAFSLKYFIHCSEEINIYSFVFSLSNFFNIPPIILLLKESSQEKEGKKREMKEEK